MTDNFTFELDRSYGWRKDQDFAPLSVEASVYTEGTLTLRNEGNLSQVSLFLLEFHYETKAALLRHFGAKRYTAKIALPLSGGGYSFVREDDKVKMEFGNQILMTSDWEDFLKDFVAFESNLVLVMRQTFPTMSASKEFELLF